MNNSKLRMIFYIVLCCVLLTGAVFYTVNILTPNGEPLIDLDALIHSSETGQEGSTDAGAKVTPKPTQTPVKPENTADNPPKVTAAPTPTPIPEKKIEIEVHDIQIKYNGVLYFYSKETGSIEKLENELSKMTDEKVIIREDYAEAHAYRYIVEYVKSVVKDESLITYEPSYDESWGVKK